METPKEKAQSLFAKFQNIESERYPLGMADDDAYECAKIAVEEIISVIPMYIGNLNPKWKFWDDVKTELNKL